MHPDQPLGGPDMGRFHGGRLDQGPTGKCPTPITRGMDQPEGMVL